MYILLLRCIYTYTLYHNISPMKGLGDPIFNTTSTKYHEARRRNTWDHTALYKHYAHLHFSLAPSLPCIRTNGQRMVTIAIQPSTLRYWSRNACKSWLHRSRLVLKPNNKNSREIQYPPLWSEGVFTDVLLPPLFKSRKKATNENHHDVHKKVTSKRYPGGVCLFFGQLWRAKRSSNRKVNGCFPALTESWFLQETSRKFP